MEFNNFVFCAIFHFLLKEIMQLAGLCVYFHWSLAFISLSIYNLLNVILD